MELNAVQTVGVEALELLSNPSPLPEKAVFISMGTNPCLVGLNRLPLVAYPLYPEF